MTRGVASALIQMMALLGPENMGRLLRMPRQRHLPEGYGVHIPKHIRKGLSYDELQELRTELRKERNE